VGEGHDGLGRGDRADGAAETAWLVEHRLRAVLEVRNGAPVVEVAARYGASRQSVYGWKTRYEREGIGGLADRSRRPHTSPGRMPAQVEALVCELRRTHPRWGARRIVFELASRGVDGVPSRATVHRALVRNGLVEPQQQRHRRKYKRWQREALGRVMHEVWLGDMGAARAVEQLVRIARRERGPSGPSGSPAW
jgi:transposase